MIWNGISSSRAFVENWITIGTACSTRTGTKNGFLNVAMAHLTGDECDEIVLLGTEYGYHQPDYDSYIDIGAAFVNDMSTGFLQTEGSEEDWEQLIDSIADILGKGLSRD